MAADSDISALSMLDGAERAVDAVDDKACDGGWVLIAAGVAALRSDFAARGFSEAVGSWKAMAGKMEQEGLSLQRTGFNGVSSQMLTSSQPMAMA